METKPFPELLKLPEVAQILKVSRTTAYALAQNGVLQAVRFEGNVRVLRTDLETFIAKSRNVQPVDGPHK